MAKLLTFYDYKFSCPIKITKPTGVSELQQTLYLKMNVTIKNKKEKRNMVMDRIQRDRIDSNGISRQIQNIIKMANPEIIKIKNFTKHVQSRVIAKPLNKYKHSIETTCSYESTRPHSAEKSKKLGSKCGANPEYETDMQREMTYYTSKNSGYAIKWKKPSSMITKSMRVIMGDWLMLLASELSIPKNSYYNAMYYVDKYASLVPVCKSKYQAIGLCALFSASKLELADHPSINFFLQALENTITHSELISLEQSILFKLKFKLNPPTLYQYMVLLVSIFDHFIKEKNPGFFDLKKDSQLYKDIFWILDGIHLENQYREHGKKQQICLAILYVCLKKDRCLRGSRNRGHLMSELESVPGRTATDKLFEEYLSRYVRDSRLQELNCCVKFVSKWAKFDRSSVSEQGEGELMKRIIFNNI